MIRFCFVTTVLATILNSAANAQELACDWQGDKRVAVVDGWIEAEQGRDESSQRLRVAVWGPMRVDAKCGQLDSDPEPEITVTSRLPGTGSYYRLQIIDFREDGIQTWSYWSDGVPKFDDRYISLGKLPNGYQGAASVPDYTNYRYTQEDGLVERGIESSWLLTMTFNVDGASSNFTLSDYRSLFYCEEAGGELAEMFATTGYQASFQCMSNVELEKALVPFNDESM